MIIYLFDQLQAYMSQVKTEQDNRTGPERYVALLANKFAVHKIKMPATVYDKSRAWLLLSSDCPAPVWSEVPGSAWVWTRPSGRIHEHRRHRYGLGRCSV